jgi:O-antigen/teichoic acid export membrane protein
MVQGIEDPINGLKTYAVVSSSLFVVVTTVGVLLIMALDRRLIPRLSLVSKKAIKELLHIGGWNAVAVTSLGMHIRIDAILMNLFLGLGGNLIYGFTSQLTSYVRMLAMGVSYGLDAVTTRITSNEGDAVLKDLCFHITRLNSCIAMPAAAGLFILAEPILTIWVGDRMGDPTTELPMTEP